MSSPVGLLERKTGLRGFPVGPFSTSPVLAKRLPWQGQRKISISGSQRNWHPRWGQRFSKAYRPFGSLRSQRPWMDRGALREAESRGPMMIRSGRPPESEKLKYRKIPKENNKEEKTPRPARLFNKNRRRLSI
jgi:hypothetical protein